MKFISRILAPALVAALPALAIASGSPPSELDSFRNELRAHLESVRYAAVVALSTDQFEEATHELEGLRTTRDFEHCGNRRWYQTQRHQIRACRAVGHAVGNIAEKQRQERLSGSREVLQKLTRAAPLTVQLPQPDRRALATRVLTAVSSAFTGLGVELSVSMRDFESETLTHCGPPVSSPAVDCCVGRAITYFRETLPEQFRHARLEFEQVVREVNAHIDAYTE